ncbi:MarR family winged helix-turn-helix transcriptional regulator [Streptomyces sp. YS415]|uniref:MarR family winged helix-turn-helix transcriptional regulator n=1 Tax=Streptomyces sp. YS415 TaxID=2944806 RepID=UPI002021D760|nr:MarR family winged helix-turn-helix transcriptional regulator [Streptomyces sp. YS415]MCL7430333.1 MarR family winged helix-turn-helix transcriptional regulator [Streptomyces sp. YS415]
MSENRSVSGTGPVPTGRLSWAVFAMARAHRAYACTFLRTLDLHPGQELLLMRLLERDGQTQTALLASVELNHSTVSKSLKRMEERGLVRREAAEHDRRVMRVWLTDKGEALRGPLQRLWSALEDVTTHGMDTPAIEQYIASCEVIRQAIADRHAKG